MNEVFREFLHRFVIVYIDDILIYSRNIVEHRHHVQQVLHKLRKHRLYLELEKFKELQRFLGFANFYRRFIKDYSTITAPLTSLLRGKPKTICWNLSAHEAFLQLKKIFSTAPLLHHPDPELPFTVEVDASTTGAGAVLSQTVGEPPLLHPCAFYSRKLSPAEQNYDVGNRELLAIKLALEEWRHWLEGSKHPFTIITDQKNLQYIREAKRLNPRQARWALFFTRFNYKITYRPGSKNISADDLFLSPYVKTFWTQLISLQALDTLAANEPSRSYNLVTGGPACAEIPSEALVPHRSRLHIGVDLPAAEGNTCILVMVDRFSKMCKFFSLKGLSTAMETAEILLQHLFRHFGLPEEISCSGEIFRATGCDINVIGVLVEKHMIRNLLSPRRDMVVGKKIRVGQDFCVPSQNQLSSDNQRLPCHFTLHILLHHTPDYISHHPLR
ncbi:Transposon Tf2-9 polyprotein [Labeo rohita]|uniref:ribonuclease H n=1 Tax=Labeo rohita TaxID=84645 RepID=A0ABQ8L139_LABRO|nr:Transposon Tf2-9 polyprotein [Labeo rohita]